MGMRRLRRRLDAMQADSHRTMSEARISMSAATALLEEIQDGVQIKLVRVGNGTLWEFLRGRIDELPLRIEVAIEEGEE